MNLVIYLYFGYLLGTHALEMTVHICTAKELDKYADAIVGLDASKYLGGECPPYYVCLFAEAFGIGDVISESWPVIPYTHLAIEDDFPPEALRLVVRLPYLYSFSSYRRRDSSTTYLRRLKNVKSLGLKFEGQDLAGAAFDRSLVECIISSGNVPINDKLLRGLIGASKLRYLHLIGGIDVTAASMAAIMDNPYLEAIRMERAYFLHSDLDQETIKAWRRLERLHPYMVIEPDGVVWSRKKGFAELYEQVNDLDFFAREEWSLIQPPQNDCDRLYWKSEQEYWAYDDVGPVSAPALAILPVPQEDVPAEAESPWVPLWKILGALDYLYYSTFGIRRLTQPEEVIPHNGPVSKVAFSPDGEQLITASRDGVRIWDRQRHVWRYFSNVRDWTQFAQSPDGKYLAVSGGTPEVFLWEFPEVRPLKSFWLPDVVTSMDFSPQGRFLAVACFDGTVHVFEKPFGEKRTSWPAAGAQINSVAFITEREIATVPMQSLFDDVLGPVCVWELASESNVPRLRSTFVRGGSTVAVVPGTHWVLMSTAVSSHSDLLIAWNAFAGKYWLPLNARFLHRNPWNRSEFFAIEARLPHEDIAYRKPYLCALRPAFYSIVVFPDCRFVAAGGSEGDIRIVDVEKRRLIAWIRGHRGLVLTLAVSPNGNLLASGGKDGTVKIWNIKSIVER